MKTEQNPGAKKHKRVWIKIIAIILLVLVFTPLMVILLTPVFISSASGNNLILGIVNKSVPGKADFSDFSIGWFKGIKVKDFSFNDDAGQISISFGQLETKPSYGSLLTGNINLGKTTIDEPVIDITLPQQNTAAVSVKTDNSKTRQTAVNTAGGIAVITDIAVKNGRVTISDQKMRAVEVSQINSSVSLRRPGEQSKFNLTMNVGSEGNQARISADAQVTPARADNGWKLEGTNGEFTLEVNDLDLETLESFFALAGVDVNAQGNVSMNMKGRVVNGQVEEVTGTVNGTNLDIAPAALNGDSISSQQLNAEIQLTNNQQTVNIDKFQLDSDFLNVKAEGAVPAKINSLNGLLTSPALKANGSLELDLVNLLSQLPNTLKIKEGMQITSGKITGDITASQGGLSGQAELSQLAGTLENKTLALSGPVTGSVEVALEDETITFKQANLTAPFATIDANGNIQNIKYTGQADLAKLQAELGQFVDLSQYQLAGSFSSSGAVAMADEIITATGSARVEKLNVNIKEKGTISEPQADVDFAVDYNKENNQLNIISAAADTSFGQLGVKDGILPFNKDSNINLNATISANKLDLSTLMSYAVMFGNLPEDMQLSGIAEAQQVELQANSEWHIFGIKTDSAQVQNLKFAYQERKPFEQKEVTITIEAEIDTEKETYNIKQLQLDSPQIKLHQGSLSMVNENSDTVVSGQAESQYDWQAVSSLLAPVMPEGLSLTGVATDTLSFSSRYPSDKPDAFLSHLNATAGIGFDKAEYMGLNVGSTDVDINIVNGVANIVPFTTTVNEGQLYFACRADFNQKPALFETIEPMQVLQNIQINDQTTKQLLKYLSPLFANAVNISGIANLSCRKLVIPLDNAAKNKAEIIGIVSISQMRMQTSDVLSQILTTLGSGTQRATITLHPTEFILKDGFLSYDNMQIDIDRTPINFSGKIGLDKSLDMTVTLPYTTQGTTARVDRQTQGSRITLPLKGTVDKPEIDLEKLLEDQLKQQLDDVLRRGLEGIFG